nr:MAG TPA: hypothetical protein [Caudoviricetes sp.]
MTHLFPLYVIEGDFIGFGDKLPLNFQFSGSLSNM